MGRSYRNPSIGSVERAERVRSKPQGAPAHPSRYAELSRERLHDHYDHR